MTLYRPHRGSLAAAMKEVSEFDGLAELVKIMRVEVDAWYPLSKMPTVENTVVENYGYGPDKRIGWKDTFIVLVNGKAWGFTEGPVE